MPATRSRLTVLLVVFSVAAPAVAQPPDLLRSYEFLTRHSTLTVSGGIAGWYFELPIHGGFDFVTGFRRDLHTLDPYAAFLNVEAEGINPTDFGPYSFDVDDSLNLSGLDGEPLPVAAPFNLYHFQGEDLQGAPVELYVAELGRWLYMKGRNDPGCCDMFSFGIKALARQTPHPDFNRDGVVDRLDLDLWEAHAGIDDGADADGNGTSDGIDFLVLQREFGSAAPSTDYFDAMISAALAGGALATVPEPGSMALALLGCVLMLRGRRG